MAKLKATVYTMSTFELEIKFDEKAPPDKERSYYDELMSFFNSGVIPRLTHSQFGFDDLCYYSADVEVPTEKQMKDLKERLRLIVTLSFTKEKMEETLKEYATNPSKYREVLGEGFEWVRTSSDASYFPLKDTPSVSGFSSETRKILYEFDPIFNKT